MNAFKRFEILMLIAAAGLFNAGCGNDDDDDGDATPSVRFSSSESTADEDDGTIEIQLSSTVALASDAEVSFGISGSAYLDGDYSLETPSPITFKAGEKTATIVLKIIDESTIESGNDELTIELTSIGTNASLSETSSDLEHTVIISDNDNAATNKLQIDLTWDIGDDDESIDEANLDLYLATNVIVEDGAVTSADLYSESANTSGFETLWLQEEDEDTEYYIVVGYTEGDGAVEFTLNLNGMGLTNDGTTETLASENEGSALFYGPLTKSGSSIGRKENARIHHASSLKGFK